MRNALLRLGWSHGDDEIIDTAQAIAWFDLDGVNCGAARFDMEKLKSLNGHYIRASDDDVLLAEVEKRLADQPAVAPDERRRRIMALLPEAKQRAKTLVELADALAFLFREPPLPMTTKAERLLDDKAGQQRLWRLALALQPLDRWDDTELEMVVRNFAEREDVKLGKVAQPLRAALTGSHASPGIFVVMAALGREETLARLDDAARARAPYADAGG